MALSKEAEATWRKALAEFKATAPDAMHVYHPVHPETLGPSEELEAAGIFERYADEYWKLTAKGLRGP